MSETPERRIAPILGLLVCRVLVPAWILTGATFKLLEGNPGLLPRGMLKDAHALGLNLDVLLATAIALEFLAVAVILFVGRFARLMASFILSCFLVILVREIATGASSCGCLGSFSPSPWMMLAIDATLLAGVAILKPGRVPHVDTARWPIAAAVLLVLVTAGVSFGKIIPWESRSSASAAVPDDPAAPEEIPLPSYFVVTEAELEAWVGQLWSEVKLFQLMETKPRDLNNGTRYVVFYRRSCDHCEAVFTDDLAHDPDLAAKVTAVQIPDGTDLMTGEDAWPMPETGCEKLALPLGPDWIITPPLALRIEEGIVRCATEGEHRGCLELGSAAGDGDAHAGS